jgi:hypothetical protein
MSDGDVPVGFGDVERSVRRVHVATAVKVGTAECRRQESPHVRLQPTDVDFDEVTSDHGVHE